MSRRKGEAILPLLFLLAGVWGPLLICASIETAVWNRPAVFLLGALPCVVLWATRLTKARWARTLGILSLPIVAGLLVYLRPGTLLDLEAAAGGFLSGQALERDVTWGVALAAFAFSYVMSLLELVLGRHWPMYWLSTGLTLGALLLGIKPGWAPTVCIAVFQISFWASRGLRGRVNTGAAAVRMGALTAAAAVALFAIGGAIAWANMDLISEKALQVEGTMQRAARQLTGVGSGISGRINRGNLYSGERQVMELRTSQPPDAALYLRDFSGGDYIEGQWLTDRDQEILQLTEESFPKGSLWRDWVQPIWEHMYLLLCTGQPREMSVSFENGGILGNMPAPYYSAAYILRWTDGESPADVWCNILYYQPEEVNIDWDHLPEGLRQEEAEMMRNIQSAYMRLAKDIYTQLPEDGLDRLRRLCLANPKENVEDAAAFILYVLRTQAEYTTTPGPMPVSQDPVEYFLFERGAGYCQHFASAAVLMFRMYGIPARYASGYVVEPSDFQMGEEGVYTAYVTEASAHAWPEIFIEDRGWVPVEVTPPGGVLEEPSPIVGLQAMERLSSEGEPDLTAFGQGGESMQGDAGLSGGRGGDNMWLYLLLPGVLLLILAFFAVRRALAAIRFARLGCGEVMDKLSQMLQESGRLKIEASWEENLNDLLRCLPEEQWEGLAEAHQIALRDCYGPGNTTEEERETVRRAYKEAASNIGGHMNGARRFLFKYVKNYC